MNSSPKKFKHSRKKLKFDPYGDDSQESDDDCDSDDDYLESYSSFDLEERSNNKKRAKKNKGFGSQCTFIDDKGVACHKFLRDDTSQANHLLIIHKCCPFCSQQTSFKEAKEIVAHLKKEHPRPHHKLYFCTCDGYVTTLCFGLTQHREKCSGKKKRCRNFNNDLNNNNNNSNDNEVELAGETLISMSTHRSNHLRHIEINDHDAQDEYRCRICSRIFNTQSELLYHKTITNHDGEEPDFKKQKLESSLSGCKKVIQDHDFDKVRDLLLQQNIDVNTADENDEIPLHHAAQEYDENDLSTIKIFHLILNNTERVNQKSLSGLTPLDYVVNHASIKREAAFTLIRRGAVSDKALVAAVKAGDFLLIKSLLECGADLKGIDDKVLGDLLEFDDQKLKWKIRLLLLIYGASIAYKNGDEYWLRKLSIKNLEAFKYGIFWNQLQIDWQMKMLRDSYFGNKISSEQLSSAQEALVTIQNLSFVSIQQLQDIFSEYKNAQCPSKDIFKAAQEGDLTVISAWLTVYGYHVDARDATGKTALSYACEYNQTKAIQLIKEFGSNEYKE